MMRSRSSPVVPTRKIEQRRNSLFFRSPNAIKARLLAYAY
jgi:hypothetical protein